jgi:glutathione S-transferase
MCLNLDILAWRTLLFERDFERKAQGRVLLEGKFRLYYAKFSKILETSGGDYVIGNKLTHADFWLASFISVWDEPLVRTEIWIQI